MHPHRVMPTHASSSSECSTHACRGGVCAAAALRAACTGTAAARVSAMARCLLTAADAPAVPNVRAAAAHDGALRGNSRSMVFGYVTTGACRTPRGPGQMHLPLLGG